MSYNDILVDIQCSINQLQDKLDILRAYTPKASPEPIDPPIRDKDFLMTRKEAAAFIGRSLRHLDRLLAERKISRTYVDGTVRIKKSELLRYQGHVLEDEDTKSTLDQLRERYLG